MAPRGSKAALLFACGDGVELAFGARTGLKRFFRLDMVALAVDQVFGWLERTVCGAVAGWST
jgi:hypothetical protein